MEEIRKYHNESKRLLIQSATREGDSILDVGCGFGGDLQKWRHVPVSLCDLMIAFQISDAGTTLVAIQTQ